MTINSNSSSTSSLSYQPSRKRSTNNMKVDQNTEVDGISVKVVKENTVKEPNSNSSCDKQDLLKKSATICLENPKEYQDLSTVKSPSCSSIQTNQGSNVKNSYDVYSKGACSSMKSIFEENIAVKKGLKPDPTAPQGVVKVKSRFHSQLPSAFVANQEKKAEVKKDPVVVDKIIFKKFLGKFETDQSRELAKSQLRQLTASQKVYNAKRNEKLEEQRRLELEEAERVRVEEEAQRLREELEKKRRIEEEERLKKEEEQKKLEAEKAAALAKKEAKKAAAIAKKQAKLLEKKEVAQVQLPKLISSSFLDFKEKFQTKKSDSNLPAAIERPRARKIIDNPFEQKMPLPSAMEKKSPSSNFLSAGSNRISEMKKRYSQLFTQPQEDHVKIPNPMPEKMEVDVSIKVSSPQLIEMPVEQPSPHNRILDKPRESFLTRSKEHLDKSCEKIIRYSKEKLNELTGNNKPSKDDMKCYLLSHILYDGEKAISNNSETLKNDDLEIDEDVELEKGMFEDEYIKSMEKYLACFDSDKKKSKTVKAKNKKNNFEPSIKLKTIEVNDIKKQFEQSNVEKVSESGREIIALEKSVGKVKDIFEKSDSNSNNVESVKPVRKSGKLLSQDLLVKFDSPENRKRLEEEREERRLQRMAKLVEDMKRAEEEERRRAEEEVKKAEEEAKRAEGKRLLEEKRLARFLREEEERQKLEAIRKAKQDIEDAKERAKQAAEDKKKKIYEDAVRETREKAELRNQREALIKQQREKNEPAFKKRKVLGRIQHMFEKKLDDPGPVPRGGKTGGGDVESAARNFQETPSSGLSQMLGRVKDKFEVKEEKPQTIFHGVTIAKKDIPAAETFAMIEQKRAEQVEVARPAASEDWAWKKKDPKLLAVESTIAMYGTGKETIKKKDNNRDKNLEKKNDLYADLTNLKSRLAKRDALKESEEKMKEYAKFMEEIQGYLNEPNSSMEEKNFKNDIQNYIQQAAATANKKKHAKKRGVCLDKAAFQWNNHLNEIRELVEFLNECKNATIEKFISQYLTKVMDNLSDQDPDSAIEDFHGLMSGIHKFLNGPDTSKEEINLKCEIEGYLDQIGEPVIDEEKPSSKIGKTPRLPQKLNLDAFSFNIGQCEEPLLSVEKAKVRDSQGIKDLQMKLLFGEKSKDHQLSKEEFLVPNIAIDKLKKDYEKLQNQDETITLLPGPKLTLKQVEDTLPYTEISPNTSKPISAWKWKEKLPLEVQNESSLSSAQTKVVLESKSQKTETRDEKSSEMKLQSELSVKNLSKIKEMEELRDKELEAFISSMEEILDSNETSSREAASNKKATKKSSLVANINDNKIKTLSMAGSVSTIKTLLEQTTEQDKSGDPSRPKVGKLNTDLIELIQTNSSTSVSKVKNEPIISNIDANKIKKKLEMQNPAIQESKVLFQAPKTKLKESLVLQEKNDTISVIGDLLREKRSSSVFVNKPVQHLPPQEKIITTPVSKQLSKSDTKKVYKSQYEQFKSEEEKRAAILAKYGVRPRNVADSSDSSSSDEEDQALVARKLAEQKETLKQMYGLNDIRERRKDRLEEKRIRDNSLSTLRNVLIKLRDAKGGSITNLNEADGMTASNLDLSKKKSIYSSNRDLFENGVKDDEPEAREMISLERSSTFSNVKSVFDNKESRSRSSRRDSKLYDEEDNKSFSNAKVAFEAHRRSASATRPSDIYNSGKKSSDIPGNLGYNRVRNTYLEMSQKQTLSSSTFALNVSGLNSNEREIVPLERSSTFSNVKSVFGGNSQSNSTATRTSDIFSPGKRNSETPANPTFNKVRDTFEKNLDCSDYESSDDDDDRSKQKSTSLSQRDLIQAELDELRAISRKNSVFRINHSRQEQSLMRSSSSTQIAADKLELDSKTLGEVSRTRQDMKKFFESSAPKVTFGGACAFGAEKATPIAKPVQTNAQPVSDRGWVYDIINKYFDVIEEDEEGSEDEEDNNLENISQCKSENPKVRFDQFPLKNDGFEEEEDDEEEEEEEDDSSEEEDQAPPNTNQFGLMRSTSSSKMRSLFRSVIEKNRLGPDLGLETFKANLGTHLRDRGSTLSLHSLGGDQDERSNYQETKNYKRIPL